jgi:hypothetical protein
MINFVVAYDDRDVNLGTYFEDCKNQLLEVLGELNEFVEGKVREMPGQQCNNAAIDLVMPQYQPKPFIFTAYSHGNENALCCKNNNYIEKDNNAHHFANSLFYTTACSAGKELGPHLIDMKCLAFVGYESEICTYMQDDRKDISKKCDNAGIIAFLSENITISEAYIKMKTYYTQQIDRLNGVKDILFAGDLVEARDALVCLGNKDLKKEDLFISE